MLYTTSSLLPAPLTFIGPQGPSSSEFFAQELKAGNLHVFFYSWWGVLDRQLDDEKERSVGVKLDGWLNSRCLSVIGKLPVH